MLLRTARTTLALGALITASACATTTPVMDAGNGNYMISARASAVRGGAAGAQGIAYQDANAYCAQRMAGGRAVVSTTADRDVYQASYSEGANAQAMAAGTTGPGPWRRSGVASASANYYSAGSVSAAGIATLHFRCET